MDLTDRDGTVERHDPGGREGEQLVVEGEDLTPVGLFERDGVGVHGEELIVRIDPASTDALLKEPGARLFDITGRPMKGWLMVGGAGIKEARSLAKWVRRGVGYASSLPKK